MSQRKYCKRVRLVKILLYYYQLRLAALRLDICPVSVFAKKKKNKYYSPYLKILQAIGPVNFLQQNDACDKYLHECYFHCVFAPA